MYIGDFSSNQYSDILQHSTREFCSNVYRGLQQQSIEWYSTALYKGILQQYTGDFSSNPYRDILPHSTREFCSNIQGTSAAINTGLFYSKLKGNYVEIYSEIAHHSTGEFSNIKRKCLTSAGKLLDLKTTSTTECPNFSLTKKCSASNSTVVYPEHTFENGPNPDLRSCFERGPGATDLHPAF
jgi:hypothetical protein